jgi:hypothetical protein
MKRMVLALAVILVVVGMGFGSTQFLVNLKDLDDDTLVEFIYSLESKKTCKSIEALKEEVQVWTAAGVEEADTHEVTILGAVATHETDSIEIDEIVDLLTYWECSSGICEVMYYDLCEFGECHIGATRLSIMDPSVGLKPTIMLFRATDETNSIVRVFKYLS